MVNIKTLLILGFTIYDYNDDLAMIINYNQSAKKL